MIASKDNIQHVFFNKLVKNFNFDMLDKFHGYSMKSEIFGRHTREEVYENFEEIFTSTFLKMLHTYKVYLPKYTELEKWDKWEDLAYHHDLLIETSNEIDELYEHHMKGESKKLYDRFWLGSSNDGNKLNLMDLNERISNLEDVNKHGYIDLLKRDIKRKFNDYDEYEKNFKSSLKNDSEFIEFYNGYIETREYREMRGLFKVCLESANKINELMIDLYKYIMMKYDGNKTTNESSVYDELPLCKDFDSFINRFRTEIKNFTEHGNSFGSKKFNYMLKCLSQWGDTTDLKETYETIMMDFEEDDKLYHMIYSGSYRNFSSCINVSRTFFTEKEKEKNKNIINLCAEILRKLDIDDTHYHHLYNFKINKKISDIDSIDELHKKFSSPQEKEIIDLYKERLTLWNDTNQNKYYFLSNLLEIKNKSKKPPKMYESNSSYKPLKVGEFRNTTCYFMIHDEDLDASEVGIENTRYYEFFVNNIGDGEVLKNIYNQIDGYYNDNRIIVEDLKTYVAEANEFTNSSKRYDAGSLMQLFNETSNKYEAKYAKELFDILSQKMGWLDPDSTPRWTDLKNYYDSLKGIYFDPVMIEEDRRVKEIIKDCEGYFYNQQIIFELKKELLEYIIKRLLEK